MEDKIIRRVGQRLAISCAALVMCAAVSAQDGTSTTPTADKQETTPVEAASEQPSLQFPRSVPPLPKGQIKVLTAKVIDVKKTAKWRPSNKAEWKAAKVNDLLSPGAQIQTGFRSSITLRVGKNATVMVGRSSRVYLPKIVQNGDVLITRLAMGHGRCDIKVDQVGPANDLEVITSTTTLAVGGTGFAVTWGALEGVEIDAVATNVIRAIEVRYLLTNMSYYLSGNGATRENQPNPVEVAWDYTISPTIPGGLVEGEFFAGLQSERRVDYSRFGLERTLELVSDFPPPLGATPTPTPPGPTPPPTPPGPVLSTAPKHSTGNELRK